MARSTYIYVVRDTGTDDIIAAFTVKHELISWINSNALDEVEPWEVYRCRDNPRFVSDGVAFMAWASVLHTEAPDART